MVKIKKSSKAIALEECGPGSVNTIPTPYPLKQSAARKTMIGRVSVTDSLHHLTHGKAAVDINCFTGYKVVLDYKLNR